MAEKKFSELSAASTLDGTETVAVVQSGTSVRTTTAAIGNKASTVQLSNTGLTVLDTDASHALTIKPGSDLTAARILTVTTGDADRTLTISGDATLPAGTAAMLTASQTLSNTILGASSGVAGFYGTTPIAQPSGANQAAVTTTAPVSGIGYGFSYAQATAILTLLNELRSAFVALGLIKGSA